MDIKTLLIALLEDGNVNVPSDIILDNYIEKAKNAIKKHSVLSEDDYTKATLINQTAELAMYYCRNQKTVGMKNKSEGIKSFSFEAGIPQSIKDTLPLPCIISM